MGIAGHRAQEIEIIDSDISGNIFGPGSGAGASDAVVYLNGANIATKLEVLGSTIHGGTCDPTPGVPCSAGGIWMDGCGTAPDTGLIMRNSTVSENPGVGVGLSGCSGTIENSTLVEDGSRGVWVSGTAAFLVTARNTIIANNGVEDCNVDTDVWDSDLEHNLSSDDSCELNPVVSDIVNAEPQLQPLGPYPPTGIHIAPAHYPRWAAW